VIKTFDYLTLLEPIEAEIMAAIQRTLHSGSLILGPETEAFEQEFAAHVGAKHCIGVTSGTTALHLALLGLNIGLGDEVITVANTCVPTVAAIELTGATPVFVDVRDEDLMIDPDLVEQALTKRTRCILPVHLWGQGVDIARLVEIARQADISILEDCAQAQGTHINGQHAGTFGVAGCFSFYPTKNLGAYGDAGAIITDNDELAARLRRQRMYGYTRPNYAEEPGMNARIAELQAAILRVKLRYLPEWLERRRAIADRYHRELNNPLIQVPHLHEERGHAYHQFVIRCQDRAQVIAALEAQAIGSAIHYPTPVHQMPPYRHLGGPLPITERASAEILSIPIHEALTDHHVDLIIATLNEVD
jgi:aminotransferase EvaB